jgi:hypothetical protein
MATRTSPGEGDYNLSHPINSFVDVARRVVLQPVGFFAGLPRDRNFVSPLLFARDVRESRSRSRGCTRVTGTSVA